MKNWAGLIFIGAITIPVIIVLIVKIIDLLKAIRRGEKMR